MKTAMLALPFAYGKLEVHGRAAIYYGRALDAFSAEIEKLNASIDSIREGKFLESLVREEIRKDKDWLIRLRSLPEAPETYYLMELMASHDFQTGLSNYLDLEDLVKAAHKGNKAITEFDTSCFNGKYITGDIDENYLEMINELRNDSAAA